MTKETYALLEDFLCASLTDSAHDREHVFRVLYTALDIAQTADFYDSLLREVRGSYRGRALLDACLEEPQERRTDS